MPAKKSSAPKKTSSGKKKVAASKSASSTKSVSSTKSAASTKSASSTKSSGKKAAAAAAAPAPAPVVAAPAPAPVVAETTSVDTIESEFVALATKLSDLRALQASINSDLKRLQKAVQRHIKDTSKKQRRKKNTDPNRQKRAPSGFAKPALISPELCSFLNKPEGTEMARTEVTKFLTKYISDNNLQDQSNKRKILPDTALKSLLNVGTNDEVTYFNLQKYMKVHFPKSVSA